jgi:hypothetical protein
MKENQSRSQSRGAVGRTLAALLGACAVFFGGAASGDDSGDFHSEKTVTWDISAKGVVVGGPNTGQYRYAYHAFAEDAHADIQHKDNEDQSGGFFTKLADHLDPDAKHTGATVVTANHNYTAWTGFNQAGGNQVFGPFGANATSTHPKTRTLLRIDYTQPVPGQPNQAQAKITLNGGASIQNFPDKPAIAETAYSEAAAAADVKLTGKITAASVVNGKGPAQNFNAAIGNASVHSQAQGGAVSSNSPTGDGGRYSDPVSLTLYDSKTGALVAQQTLLSLEWSTRGTAGVDYSPTTGMSLSADRSGDASITFDTPGSWVLDPFHGSAEIVNGVFSATGDLANLAWGVTTMNGQTTASLDPSALSLDFNLAVQPTGLGTPTSDLTAVLDFDSTGFAQAYATSAVPEPGALAEAATALGLVGSWLLSRRARRPRAA